MQAVIAAAKIAEMAGQKAQAAAKESKIAAALAASKLMAAKGKQEKREQRETAVHAEKSAKLAAQHALAAKESMEMAMKLKNEAATALGKGGAGASSEVIPWTPTSM